MIPDFTNFPLPVNAAFFFVFAGAIWIAGTRLTRLADAIGDTMGIGRALMGLVYLAAITELPELVTTAAAAYAGDAPLALGNMFGGIVMQTAVLAVADAFAIHAVITAYPRKPTPILEGILLILLLSGILGIVSVGEIDLFAGIGLGTVMLAGAYIGAIILLNAYDKNHAWRPVDLPEFASLDNDDDDTQHNSFRGLTKRALVLATIMAAVVILVCGLLLVEVASSLASQTGLGSGFIGVTLLAASTSLPELSTTIAAVRMGAYTMAISNIFGSNLVMVFVLFPADIFYTDGPILEQADETAGLALLAGIFVTAIYAIGLLIKHKPRIMGVGLDSLVVMIIYMLSLVAFYFVR